ncbi:MAG: DUF1761 domain-containing protein [Ignavibacteriales bacterium]|jgi:hypothetical protein|nr:DUF1761 domain-containing protein [Ignavibacteriales bacterium]
MILLSSVNYLAVLFCGVIGVVLGWFWFSPFLFGKMWLDAIDRSDEEIKKNINPIKTFGLSFIANLVLAYVLARVMTFVNATTISEGIRIGFLCWIGFTLATNFINTLFEKRQLKLVILDAGYHLIVILTFGSILGLWQ